jgi:hypothetical protein
VLVEILQDAFRRADYNDIKHWHKQTKCPLSYYTCTTVLNESKEPSVPSFIVMAYLLEIPTDEIARALKDAGDGIFWRLIDPPGHPNEYRSLSSAKKKLVDQFIETLR